MANRTKLTDRVKAKFLTVLREHCNVSEAARACGIARQYAYEVRGRDEAFAKLWIEAEQEAADKLEREAWRRGVEGTDKPIVYQGEVTGTYKEYSDRMLELLLKAHRGEKFKERADVPTHNVQINVIKWMVLNGPGDQGRADIRAALEAEPV